MSLVAERFWAKAVRDPETECWEWIACRNSWGYGQFDAPGFRYAHRFAYSYLVGPIPEGLTIDHLCRNRGCVNPDHLEACRMGVNTLRGNAPTAKHARKTHCSRGHAFDEANTRITAQGHRVCRKCKAENSSAYGYRRRAREGQSA